jgi:hypothetical protein
MQGRHLFEYAVIRVVPRVERDEFINVGVILYCAKKKYLEAIYHIDEQRLGAFCPNIDIADVRCHLDSLMLICRGEKNSGPIGQLDLPSRFRWLTAMRSTVIQTSRVHPGFCTEPESKLQALFDEQVL